MKTSVFNITGKLVSTARLVAGLLVVFLGVRTPLHAQTPATANDKEIRITADKLETFNDKNLAVFSGNVHATQADTVIDSDRLEIYYDRQENTETAGSKPKKPDKNPAPKEGEKGSVKRVVAIGGVKIRSGDRLATTEKAEYTSETGIIVLTGENSKVNSGNNSVTGNKITMYRNEDRVVVESGEKKRVEAVVYSGDQKLME